MQCGTGLLFNLPHNLPQPDSVGKGTRLLDNKAMANEGTTSIPGIQPNGTTGMATSVGQVAPCEDTSVYDRFYQFIAAFGGYLVIFFVGLGIFGNILSLTIFIRQRKRDNASASYLGCLAISDLCNLLTGVRNWAYTSLYHMSFRQIGIWSISSIQCKIRNYFWFNGRFLSGWILIAFTVERTIAVIWPLKTASIATPGRRKWVLTSLIITSLVIWIYVAVYYHSYPPFDEGRNTCFWALDEIPQWISVVFITHYFASIHVLPSLVITTLNIVIVIGIKVQNPNVRSDKNDPSRSKKEMRCLINLLIVSTTYVVLVAPFVGMASYQIYQIINGGSDRSEAYIDFVTVLANFANNIALINYSVNFIIYTISLDFYREEARKIMRCKWT
jgi:hypothetical protein